MNNNTCNKKKNRQHVQYIVRAVNLSDGNHYGIIDAVQPLEYSYIIGYLASTKYHIAI